MKNNLLFDFTVDKGAKSVYITREFDAGLSLVWDAFTKQEILDQWWAPKPYESRTKVMEFKVGGRRFYSMVGPEGQEHWGIQKYTGINPKSTIEWWSAFTDKDENVNTGLPNSDWTLNFSEKNGTTTVHIEVKHKSLEHIEILIQMGFREGFTMILNQLESLLHEHTE